MNNIRETIIGVFQIALINLVMSGDNLGIIALAIKNLPREYAKKASATGIIGAILLRIFFTLIITLIMRIDWLPIKLIGGIVLIKITWDFIKPQEKEQTLLEKSSATFWSAVLSIILADIAISLDNVLVIGVAAKGNIWLIIWGLLINVPIIFFGSQLLNQYFHMLFRLFSNHFANFY
ncbi:YjbE family putative metal transport protein [Desulfosporosinus sp. SB140]|uniref:YjbE family putative metal transport protein n=1 Tax=Desulfosporosinus paludis TaxID=3115649 RepID=UPI00388D971B